MRVGGTKRIDALLPLEGVQAHVMQNVMQNLEDYRCDSLSETFCRGEMVGTRVAGEFTTL